ncbi:MAG: DUF6484 domain-containing protein [Planctomycetota bacterium]|jgi:hypothetical protein
MKNRSPSAAQGVQCPSELTVEAREEQPSQEPADLWQLGILRTEPSRRIDGVVIGRVAKIEPSGTPLVDFPDNALGRPLPARSIVPLEEKDLGREVVLQFERGDAGRPVVLGLLHPPKAPPAANTAGQQEAVEAQIDGEKVVITGQSQVVLRCGKASITLTRAGKILIRGAYLLSRSSGVNRIKGGSVQIN